MAVWPENKGPLAGKCPECRDGDLVLWYSDRIYRVYKCVKCGMMHDRRGYVKKVSRQEMREVVDKVFGELGMSAVSKRAFIETVDKVCYEELGGRIPVILRGDFERWGYVVDGGIIRRRA